MRFCLKVFENKMIGFHDWTPRLDERFKVFDLCWMDHGY